MEAIAGFGLELMRMAAIIAPFILAYAIGNKIREQTGRRWAGWAAGIVALVAFGITLWSLVGAIEEYRCRHHGYCQDDREADEDLDRY